MSSSNGSLPEEGIALDKSLDLYFAVSSQGMEELSSRYQPHPMAIYVLIAVYHAMRVALFCSRHPPQVFIPINEDLAGGPKFNKFYHRAVMNQLAMDQFFGLRNTGPSYVFLKANLPRISTPLELFQHLLWRMVAWGYPTRLVALHFLSPSNQFYPMMVLLNTSTPGNVAQNKRSFLDQLSGHIESWINNKAIQMGVYGQVFVRKENVRTILEKLFKLSESVMSNTTGSLRTFLETRNLFDVPENKVPGAPSHSITAWLMQVDLSDYDLCQSPTPLDVTKHILRPETESDPLKAIKHIAKTIGFNEQFSVDSLGDILESTMQILYTSVIDMSTPDAPEVIREIGQAVTDCTAALLRPLDIGDVEHLLCMLSRELGLKKLKATTTTTTTASDASRVNENEENSTSYLDNDLSGFGTNNNHAELCKMTLGVVTKELENMNTIASHTASVKSQAESAVGFASALQQRVLKLEEQVVHVQGNLKNLQAALKDAFPGPEAEAGEVDDEDPSARPPKRRRVNPRE